MAIVYSLIKNENVFTLENQGEDSFIFTLYRKTCGEDEVVMESQILALDDSLALLISVDGSYWLELQEENPESEETPTIILLNEHPRLLASFINDVEDMMCGCPCSDCDCEQNCESMLLTLAKGASYFSLNSTEMAYVHNCVSGFMSCNIENNTSCLIAQEFMLGTGKPEDLIRNLIIGYYVTFYFHELNEAISEEGKAEIKLRYKSAKILKCIYKTGFDVSSILCNPPIPVVPPEEEPECFAWTWYIGAIIKQDEIISIKYFNCDNVEVIETQTVAQFKEQYETDNILFCTNGLQPIINIGTLQSVGTGEENGCEA